MDRQTTVYRKPSQGWHLQVDGGRTEDARPQMRQASRAEYLGRTSPALCSVGGSDVRRPATQETMEGRVALGQPGRRVALVALHSTGGWLRTSTGTRIPSKALGSRAVDTD